MKFTRPVVAVAFVAALTSGAVLAVRSDGPPPTTPAPSVNAEGSGESWLLPDDSVQAPASSLLSAVSKNAENVRVVAVVEDGGTPQVEVKIVDAAAAADTIEDFQSDPDVLSVGVDTKVSAFAADPGRGQQWALPAIKAPTAWPYGTGKGSVVAVIDTGVGASHPDLPGQVLPGAEFLGGNGAATSGDGRTDPHGHGTHVAGIIAAVADNGVGIAGVAPDAKIVPVRALGPDGSGWNSDIAASIVYATNADVDVINLSLGSSYNDAAVAQASAYALSRGVIVVAAAGNNRAKGNAVNYPAAHTGVLGVASVELDLASSSFSNTGDYVDVAAPGGVIYSLHPNGGYALMSGTSMAAPHIAGVAALTVSANGGSLNPDTFEGLVSANARDLGTPGKDPYFGVGLVNAAATLCAASGCTPPGEQPAPPTLTPTPVPALPPNTPLPTPTLPTPTPPKPLFPSPPTRTPDVVAQQARLRFATGGGSILWGTTATVAVLASDAYTGKALAGREVRIRVSPAGSLARTVTVRTDANGRAQTTFKMTSNTSVEAEFTNTEDPGTADPIHFGAAPKVNVGFRGGYAKVKVNPGGGRKVELQQMRGTRWKTSKVVRVNARGVVKVRNLSHGLWRVNVPATRTQGSIVTAPWTVR